MGKITKEWVQAALELSDQGQAKLTERERELFGLSSVRLRALINNICAPANTRYLELGVYRGSTVVAAAFGNKTTKVVGVDNFKYDDREPLKWAPEGFIWDNMKSQMEATLQRYKVGDNGVNLDNVTIIESNFEDVNWSEQEKFDVCFFDISPVNTALYDEFFNKVLEAMNNDAVLMFTQYSNPEHARELEEALLRHADKLDVSWKEKRTHSSTSNTNAYFSGVAIYGISKKAVKPVIKPVVKPTIKTPVNNA